MSDSFADLWSASAPAKPKPQTLSSALSSSSTQHRSTTASKPDVFALLAGSGSTPGSGTSTPRYGTGLGPPASGGSRPITPSLSTLSTVPATTNTIGRQTTPQPPPQSIAKTGSRGAADAFGDLFAPSSTAAGSGNMTLAARLAMEAQRKGSSAQLGRGGGAATASSGAGGDASAWAGLDALSGGLTAVPVAGRSGGGQPSRAQGVVVDDVDDWGLSDFGRSAAATVGAASRAAGSRNGAGAERLKQKTATTNLWDLDDFAASTTPASGSTSGAKNGAVHSQSISTAGRNGSRTAHRERVTSPDDEFDFGGREDRVDEARWAHKGHATRTDKLLDLFDDDHDLTDGPQSSRGLLDPEHHDHNEDDVLGMLSKPISGPKTRYTPSPDPFRHRRSPPASAPRPPSPPPHVLGQIVEMGFSVPQARAALAQTATGLDVPAAIERLLNGSSSPAPPPATHLTPPARAAPQPETPPTRPRSVPKGQKERERERLERQRTAAGAAGAAGEGGALSTPSVAELQEHADKLLAQASEIGLSVFSKASAMWGKGREKVVKAYEERAGGTPAPFADATAPRGARAREGAGRAVDGRPKWMQEAVGEEYAETPQQGGFRDEDEGDGDVVFDDGGSFPAEQTRPGKATHHEEEVDLFSDASATPRTHTQSSAPSTRPGPPHGRPTPGRQQSASSSRSTPAASQPIPPAPERTLPTASPAALAAALKHKTTGTAQFKLGQHAAAADAYTAGLRALPAGHLLRVPLYTNRALARIRCGEYQAAEDDCARALRVVLGDPPSADDDDALGLDPHAAAPMTEGKSVVWTPAALPPSLATNATQTAATAWAHPQGRGVDLADGYVKALRRRAEAREGREKWAAAAHDWEVLAGCAWAPEGVRRDAMRGRGRCRGMMTDDATASANGATTTTTTAASSRPKPTPKPKPRPTPAPSVPSAPSQALRALQSQNAQAEADESLKDSLKDAVDARLAGWRQGREGNIRALLVGLDVVLWDTALEGVRVRGLHELLSPAQVKKGYVRVIARVHPDKLNSSNSTVEQRMLANGVFGTLNEAWIAFQATQK
ncbi:hypothetical protein BJ912DRAFT_1002335 [Pholiota molesta]|nr:hypothetical protein BJ912DRAFT_1002335 [Pholiota molesta]